MSDFSTNHCLLEFGKFWIPFKIQFGREIDLFIYRLAKMNLQKWKGQTSFTTVASEI